VELLSNEINFCASLSSLFSAFSSFIFKITFSAKKQTCGPGARALGGKSIGGRRIPTGDPIGFPQKEAGPPGARPGAPTTE